jgi:hypothetical protein
LLLFLSVICMPCIIPFFSSSLLLLSILLRVARKLLERELEIRSDRIAQKERTC